MSNLFLQRLISGHCLAARSSDTCKTNHGGHADRAAIKERPARAGSLAILLPLIQTYSCESQIEDLHGPSSTALRMALDANS